MEGIYDFYKKFNILFTCITFVLCVLKEKWNGYTYIFLIPLFYLPFFTFTNSMHRISRKKVGMLLLNIIMFYKYIITSFLVVLNQDFNAPHAYVNYIESYYNSISIFYLLGEMISIFLIIIFLNKKIYKFKNINEDNDMKEHIGIEKMETTKTGFVIKAFLIIGTILLVIYPGEFIPSKLLYLNDEFEAEKSTGFFTIISYAYKVVLISVLINKCIYKYKESNKKVFILLSYLLILTLCLLNTSTSRTNMIVPLLLFLLITKKIFDIKYALIPLFIIAIILSVNLSAVSRYKFSWKYENNVDNNALNVLQVGDSLQEYTSFIRPVAAALATNNMYSKELGTRIMLNDTFGSIPILNHMVNKEYRYNNYYNYFVFNVPEKTSKIAPLIGYSIIYFGKFGFFILTDLCVIVLMVIDNKIKNKKETFLENFIIFYLLFVLADSICCSYQSIIGRIFVRALPILIINELSKTCIKKDNYKTDNSIIKHKKEVVFKDNL